MRLYPPLPLLNRRCVKDYKIPNSEIIIEKDTNVIVPVIGLHYDADYFPDPEKFDPERFSEENKHKIIPYTYIPFGEGPRYCIGDRFGKQEMKLGIVTLLKKYKIKLNPKIKLPLQLGTGFVTEPLESILINVEPINA